MLFKVTTFGRVYRANGATSGVLGVMGDLTRDDVLSQIQNATARGEWLRIDDENGTNYPMHTFAELAYAPGDAVQVNTGNDRERWVDAVYRATLTELSALPAADRPHLVYLNRETLRFPSSRIRPLT